MDETVLLHRIDDRLQILSATRHVFEDNSVLDRLALKERIAHRQRAEQPLFDAAALHVVHIGDVIPIRCCLFAFY